MAHPMNIEYDGPETFGQKLFWLTTGIVLCTAVCLLLGMFGPAWLTDGIEYLWNPK